MKNDFRRGDVLAFAYDNLTGKIIRFITRGVVNHVAIVINDNECMESRGAINEIVISKITDVIKRKGDVYHCKLTDENYDKILVNKWNFDLFVTVLNHEKYGWISALFAGLDTYLPFIPFRKRGSHCCSALVALFLGTCCIKLSQNPSEYTPQEIFDLDFESIEEL